ncbi:MAG: hypothetical protein ACK452_16245, partial [Bacteroidota bacterium]
LEFEVYHVFLPIKNSSFSYLTTDLVFCIVDLFLENENRDPQEKFVLVSDNRPLFFLEYVHFF